MSDTMLERAQGRPLDRFADDSPGGPVELRREDKIRGNCPDGVLEPADDRRRGTCARRSAAWARRGRLR